MGDSNPSNLSALEEGSSPPPTITNTPPPPTTSEREPLGEKVHSDPPYSIYTKKEKWLIVLLIAISGLFSPLTANVYFPAIPSIADAFHKSTELINLTVTMYMVFQGISPMLFGALADNVSVWNLRLVYLLHKVGRRIIYASCLLILSITCVGLALTPTSAYWLLLLLRCFQSTGSASTIALGAGVIGDIAESHERGGLIGVYQSGPLLAPGIGPVIGGALAGSLGWRSIFWFLCISSGVAFVVVIIVLPETLRSIVGNGSLLTTPIHQPLIRIVGRGRARTAPAQKTKTHKKFQNPFLILKNLDITLILFFNGIINAVYYAVTTTISTLFASAYPFLDETKVGLCFLSIGGGMFLGSLMSGRVLDWEFGRVRREMEERTKKLVRNRKDGERGEEKKTGKFDEDFPIEKARLRLVPLFMIFFIGANLGYGWCIERQVHISGPLILQFVVGCTAIIMMNASATFVVDLLPTQSSSVSACNNLFRGCLGAILVSVIDPIVDALSPGWTFVLLGCVCAAMTPIVYVVMRIGPGWRARRLKNSTRRGV
ncbi:major facilitator superfamily domain-containing protein [Lentinula aciculospora]|uniref:Major facilitator superfamily domain-containing protein n=1 Tax=Lentinula aciculospora TaxID=153920 RepID=A0A9W9AU11_9AGAR|nr:major facilitator superfamily domain-containing protein [Lentinula aciculospora]